ncbi:hypothetical protein [Caballeronia sp. RCC_10]|uniref:hypothetical protein n=1 Tax=Caballeronia sp. RCC_10 TaxID=3239227 RepID=UPI003525BAB5
MQLLQIDLEELSQLRERNQIDAIIQVAVACAGYDDQFLGLTGALVGVFAEF